MCMPLMCVLCSCMLLALGQRLMTCSGNGCVRLSKLMCVPALMEDVMAQTQLCHVKKKERKKADVWDKKIRKRWHQFKT